MTQYCGSTDSQVYVLYETLLPQYCGRKDLAGQMYCKKMYCHSTVVAQTHKYMYCKKRYWHSTVVEKLVSADVLKET